jgi:hypothetical protein
MKKLHSIVRLLAASALMGAVFSLSSNLSAQTVEQGTLDAPIAFDGGVIDIRTGGLDPNLWQGTSARLAAELIQSVPLNSSDPLVLDMIKAVLLSSAVPPEGDMQSQELYDQARLSAVSEVSDLEALEIFVMRMGPVARTPIVQAELALRKEDTQTACSLSDTITEGRSELFWSRLRTLCHLEREEFAAAELTTDLLRSNGYQNSEYFALINVLSGVSKKLPETNRKSDLINRYLRKGAATKLDFARPSQALDPQADADLRLAALFTFADQLTDVEIARVLSELAFTNQELAGGGSFDIISAHENKSAQGIGQLFLLARATGNPEDAAKAFDLLLERAPNEGVRQRFMSVLQENIRTWPASVKLGANLALYARTAADNKDIITLQNLFAALPEGQAQSRIALAADALGNGFLLGPMGSDIDQGLLAEENGRAIRDAFIALALGAQISDTALEVLPGLTVKDGRSLSEGDKTILKVNAKNRQIAQLLLRLTSLLEGERLAAPDLAFVIELLSEVGLQDFAARLAARDFLIPLETI